MRRIIDLPHRAYDFNCIISGLESLAEKHRGLRLPDRFMCLAGCIGFYYESTGRRDLPKRVWPVSGIGKGQYDFLAPLLGFRWFSSVGDNFADTWATVRRGIESGTPVIVGPLDMFHLPYLKKFHHRIHVPIHYLTLVGYDDEKGAAIVLDCGRPEPEDVPLADLSRAMDVARYGDWPSNSFRSFEFIDYPVSTLDAGSLAAAVLRERGKAFLNPGNGTEGLAALRALAEDFPRWEAELNRAAFDRCLKEWAAHTCSAAPMPPPKLAYFPVDERFHSHQGSRDVFAGILDGLARDGGSVRCADAAEAFRRSGPLFQDITDRLADYLSAPFKGRSVRLRIEALPELLGRIAGIEEEAFGLLASI